MPTTFPEHTVAALAVATTEPLGRRAARKFWTWTHRWIGLIVGVYFVVAGLSGSLLAFWQDIDELLNPNLMRVSPPREDASYKSIDEILAAARAQFPDSVKVRTDTPVFVRLPRHRAGAVEIAYMTGLPSKDQLQEAKRTKDASKLDMGSIAGHSVFVDPYTALVKGERFGGWSLRPLTMPFVYMMMSLHCALLWEPFGRLTIAGVGLVLLISTIIGLCLWLPRNGSWGKAIRIKLGAKPERVVYDIHKALGVCFGVVLLVSIFSGMYMNFKPPWRALVSFFSPVRQLRTDFESEPANGRAPLTASAAVAIADGAFPDGWLQTLLLPRGPQGVYVIGKHLEGEINQASTSRMLVIDQYSGKIFARQDPREFSAGERFLDWQYPLHSGEAFGDAGRAFMAIFGLVPLTLYVTGFIRWRHKSRSRVLLGARETDVARK
ncbi:PepSY-associated TM helix domain-containing protein [Methylocystis heyeri]|nr:PepSY-associated TM helix domain-containing protein [Methylocystis heyeri]